MAIAESPTWSFEESPKVATFIADRVSAESALFSTDTTARSVLSSVPLIEAVAVLSSAKPTVNVVAPFTT